MCIILPQILIHVISYQDNTLYVINKNTFDVDTSEYNLENKILDQVPRAGETRNSELGDSRNITANKMTPFNDRVLNL